MNSSSELPQSPHALHVMYAIHGRRRWRQSLSHRQKATTPESLTLREYLATLRPTAQTLSEAICALDLAGRIQFANRQFALALARSESELLGVNVVDLIQCALGSISISTPATATSATSARLDLPAALAQRVPVEFEECAWRQPSGAVFWRRCSLRPMMHEGRALGYMLIAPSEASERGVQDGHLRRDAERLALLAEVAQVERRLRVVETVGDIALAHLPLDELLQALLDGMRREMRLENVAIFLLSDDGSTVVARAASGAGAEIAHEVRVPLGQGVIGEVMATRKPLLIPRVDEAAQRLAQFTPQLQASMSLRSLVIAPLIMEDRVIGVLYLGASEPERFTQDDLRLVEMVGERAALAIERARASDEAARAHERLRFLSDASVALTATLDYLDTTRRLGAILTPALADASAVYLVEDDGLLRKVAVRAPSPGALAPDPLDEALRQLVERSASTIEVSRDDTTGAVARCVHTLTPVYERQPLGDAASASQAYCVAAPLVVRQHALGAIYLARRPEKGFAADDVALIQGLAERAAIAIDNARLYIETQQALASGSATATQLDTIFNATDVGIFVTDANGAMLRVNPYGARLLGLAQTDFDRARDTSKAPFELRTSEGEPIPAEREPIQLARTQGRPIEQRVVIWRSDTGKSIEALTRCTPWRDTRGQIAGAIGVVTDITAISRLERQKDEFLGVASHELKTPLTSLKILAQLLRRKLEASGDSRELAQANRMQVSITRMERLIGDLLDVSLIQEGKLALSKELTDLRVICEEAINEQETLTQRDIHFSVAHDTALPVYADPERIYQAVTNLLSNALKYSQASDPVEVRAYATAEECIVCVRDQGPGVPEEAQGHVFDRFFRVPGMQVQTGSGVGLGLGLHISKEIVERHGGRIWIESKLGHGSSFLFALPRAEVAQRAAERQAAD